MELKEVGKHKWEWDDDGHFWFCASDDHKCGNELGPRELLQLAMEASENERVFEAYMNQAKEDNDRLQRIEAAARALVEEWYDDATREEYLENAPDIVSLFDALEE